VTLCLFRPRSGPVRPGPARSGLVRPGPVDRPGQADPPGPAVFAGPHAARYQGRGGAGRGRRHFTHLLKVDRAAAYGRHSRAARIESALRAGRRPTGADVLGGGEEAVSRALAHEGHVSELELERLRLAIRMQRMAVMPDGRPHLDGGDAGGEEQGALGEREVVSCAVLNEGSPVAGPAPAPARVCPLPLPLPHTLAHPHARALACTRTRARARALTHARARMQAHTHTVEVAWAALKRPQLQRAGARRPIPRWQPERTYVGKAGEGRRRAVAWPDPGHSMV
jgi:hypothetical protein